MGEFPPSGVHRKRNWTLTPTAFDRLLGWLDEGTNSDGLKYLEMRRRLVSYFDRKNCAAPNDLADETFNRVARRLEEETLLENETPAKYCYIVARFVFLESLRALPRLDELTHNLQASATDNLPSLETRIERETKEKLLDCLELCTGRLESQSRELITRYYLGTGRSKIENRALLAKELGLTSNALSIRACRIRDKLEECVKRCAGSE